MPETLLLNYRLTKELWHRFFEAHYSCDRSLKFCSLLGAVCIIIGSVGLGGFFESPILAGVLLITGFFGVLLKPILIAKSVRQASRHPFFGQEVWVSVAPAETSIRCGNTGFSQPWGNFIGYRRLEPGFLLYQSPNAFFFIPLSAMTAGYAKRIEQILDAVKVPRL